MGLAQRASVGAGAGACLTQTRICISPQKQAPKRAGLPCTGLCSQLSAPISADNLLITSPPPTKTGSRSPALFGGKEGSPNSRTKALLS